MGFTVLRYGWDGNDRHAGQAAHYIVCRPAVTPDQRAPE